MAQRDGDGVALQRVGILAALPAILAGMGVDLEPLLASAGLEPGALRDPDGLIPYAAMGTLVDRAATASGCPHLGLLIGQTVGLAALGLVGELMRSAPTMRAALQDLVQHQPRHARGSLVYLLEYPDQVAFGYAIYERGVRAAAHIHDGAVASAYTIVAELLGDDRKQLTASISRAAPSDTTPYRLFFGTLPQFDADQSAVFMPVTWLDRAPAGSDPARRRLLLEKVAAYRPVGRDDIINQVKRATTIGMFTGTAACDDVAHRLGMTRRTMQRQLSGAGTSFQAILDGARLESALHLLLNTEIGLREIGLILGYAEPSVFSRAFTRWTGASPSAYRQDHRNQAR